MATTAPRFASLELANADQVRSFYVDEYSAHVGLGRSVPNGRFYVAANQLQLGGLEVTDHIRTVEMTFRMERDDAYIVCLTASGALDLEQGGTMVVGTPTRASIYQPTGGRAVFHSGAPNRARGLLIQRWALTTQLELMLGHPVPTAIAMAPALDLTTGGARAWLDLLNLFAGAYNDPDHIVFRPIVTEPLTQALIGGLLMISNHRYAEALRQPAATCRPRHVKIAIDAMHERPEDPHTTASLAQLARVGVRNLQAGFRCHLGMSPMAYLRQLRLSRAHDDLRTGRAATIAEAAHRWGFAHLGRFAAEYRAKYGELPSRSGRAHAGSRALGVGNLTVR
jgi:AraC-like DNA-binding protein